LFSIHTFQFELDDSIKEIQYSPLFSQIETIKFVLLFEYVSHSRLRVAGVTILTIFLLTIHLSFGSEICSAIATLYQALTKSGKYLSFAW
jgi:hypothetical protein